MEEPDRPTREGARTTHRRGRMTETRLTTIATLGPRYGLDLDAVIDADLLDTTFGRTSPRLLDIGVGNGDATLDFSHRHSGWDVLAVELHRPGIARLLRELDERTITNIRVIDADVTTLLDHVQPGAFDQIRVLFPDPWPKKRHHKRRLVDESFVQAVCDRLPVDGRLHLATDRVDYADQMRAVLATEPRLQPVVDHDDGAALDADGAALSGVPTRWRSNRPERPVTAYEQRGLDAGRQITDLVAVRTG